jgi:hypothetical protein
MVVDLADVVPFGGFDNERWVSLTKAFFKTFRSGEGEKEIPSAFDDFDDFDDFDVGVADAVASNSFCRRAFMILTFTCHIKKNKIIKQN